MSRRRLAVLGFVALLAAVALWRAEWIVERLIDWRYHVALPDPAYPKPATSADAIRQDLDHLAKLLDVDRSFSDAASAHFRSRVAALRERADALSPAQFLLGVAEAVAVADNAHTNADLAHAREILASVPVRFAWFADGLYVVRATTPYASLLGARVEAIGGVDPAVLDRDARRYVGGPPEHAHAWSVLLLESPPLLHAMRPELPDDRLALLVEDASGQRRTVDLPLVQPKDTFGASLPARLLSPVPLLVEKGTDWRTLLDPAKPLPPSLREPRSTLYAERLDPRTLYLHLWNILDGKELTADAGIRVAAGPESDPRWQRIVLDLRFNGGGDYTTVYRAIRWLPRRLATDGRMLILTDNTTFSAAIVTAAWAKHFAQGRATIVGEPIGDRLQFWAEGLPVVLPNSKLPVNIATGYHDWENGCRELRCYWANFYYDVPAGSLVPDIVIGWRFDDYRRGIDTVLERALAVQPPS